MKQQQNDKQMKQQQNDKQMKQQQNDKQMKQQQNDKQMTKSKYMHTCGESTIQGSVWVLSGAKRTKGWKEHFPN